MVKPVLLFAFGNPSRGDDALGPMLLQHISESPQFDVEQVEILNDFQLQIEHALDLQQRQLVLFIDASVACAAPFEFSTLQAQCDQSYTTHAMSPAALLHVYQSIFQQTPPPSFLLSIKAEYFELGEPLSSLAQDHLQQSRIFSEKLLQQTELNTWMRHAH